ncbi:cytochrome P450 [Suillus subaureus]|uniref:Cytochrome P450 n=1 Tax=Suillus subaureus TaxID=48587 RepID=A0A9P7E9N3_9AGAM|nr:cytochrome P450 [Suillus subaureus]KAG1815026.1 cytochrome P450 [Suillus subaureus]
MSLRFTGSTRALHLSTMATLTLVTLLYLCLAGVGVYLMKQVFAKKNHAPYPPGPRGLPLVGNIQDIPHVKPWLTFAEWGKKYGDISHINVLGLHIFVLNSVKTAGEMLDKKSSIYSDRPAVPMSGELMGYGQTLPYLRYGERFRLFRKNFHRIIGSRAALVVYHPIEEMETRRFLKRVLAKPDRLQAHIRQYVFRSTIGLILNFYSTAGAIILRICYGYEVKEDNDPLVDIAERALDQFSRYGITGDFIVDFLPSLAKLPEWFPGAGFKRLARECRETLEEMAAAPYKFVKDQMAAGTALKSFSSDLLKDRTVTAEEDHVVKWCAASLFSGVDHCITEDDIHDGYYIPKGSLIIPNMWSVLSLLCIWYINTLNCDRFMLNDPQTYANPSEFNPERFLAKDGKEPETDPRTVCFGFGRRLCPGLHLADASIWISTAMSLAVFDVSKVVENGVEITPEIDPSSGLISHPKPFKCSIEARSDKAFALIQQDTH